MDMVERDSHFPVNKLYYELQAQWREAEARREWENPPEGQPGPTPAKVAQLPPHKRCLNPFCTREPYSQHHVTELFCSKRCWDEYEYLSEPDRL